MKALMQTFGTFFAKIGTPGRVPSRYRLKSGGDSFFCCLRLDPELVERLELLREEAGNRPLTINSGYRPPRYNNAVGGKRRSRHIAGDAVDISTKRFKGNPRDLIRDARDIFSDGWVRDYRTYVHVDIRDKSVA